MDRLYQRLPAGGGGQPSPARVPAEGIAVERSAGATGAGAVHEGGEADVLFCGGVTATAGVESKGKMKSKIRKRIRSKRRRNIRREGCVSCSATSFSWGTRLSPGTE